ncbi:MAG: sulfotransferase [Chloroflexi bacterium]|nr:sulfotransferase [Chloroflexota bacterium]
MFSLQPYLGLLEKSFLRKRYEPRQPQLFILGLPRSGTTLIYQYIVHRLRVAYITNRAGHYYLAPCLITYLQRKALGDYVSDFQNRYGKVQGALSPREAGAVWGRFFGVENYVTLQEMPLKRRGTLQNTVACIQSLFGNLPFVNKNVKHMLRIEALTTIFSDAYFLVVERDLEQVALSVLRGRYANLRDPKEWWSVKPPNYMALKELPVAEQVTGQLISLQRRMDSDFAKLPQERVIRLDYESFCQEPEAIIKQLSAVFRKVGLRNTAVTHFKPSHKSPQNEEDKLLIDLVKKYEATR